jgi:hypothetical protein
MDKVRDRRRPIESNRDRERGEYRGGYARNKGRYRGMNRCRNKGRCKRGTEHHVEIGMRGRRQVKAKVECRRDRQDSAGDKQRER